MADGRSADQGERNFLAEEFVEFVVRSDPGPLDRLGLLSPTNNRGNREVF